MCGVCSSRPGSGVGQVAQASRQSSKRRDKCSKRRYRSAGDWAGHRCSVSQVGAGGNREPRLDHLLGEQTQVIPGD